MNKSVYSSRLRPLLMPVSRSTVLKGPYVSMRNSKWVCFHILVGVNGDTDVNIGAMQAKNVNGASDKELIMRAGEVFQCDGAASAEADKDKWTETTLTSPGVAGSVIPLLAQDNLYYRIFIHNDYLDADNNFDCVGIQTYGLTVGAIIAVFVEFENNRFGGDPSDKRITPSNSEDAGDKY